MEKLSVGVMLDVIMLRTKNANVFVKVTIMVKV